MSEYIVNLNGLPWVIENDDGFCPDELEEGQTLMEGPNALSVLLCAMDLSESLMIEFPEQMFIQPLEAVLPFLSLSDQ